MKRIIKVLQQGVVPTICVQNLKQEQTKWESCKRETYRSTKEDVKITGTEN